MCERESLRCCRAALTHCRPLLAVNAFDDPIIDGTALPIDKFAVSSHVYGAVTGGGGHLGWFEGSRAQRRWVLKPASQWITAAARDLPITPGTVEVQKSANGWEWVTRPIHCISGVGDREGGGGGKVGWKILSETEIVQGEEGQGPLQGL